MAGTAPYTPTTFVKGDRSRVATSWREQYDLIWDGWRPAGAAPDQSPFYTAVTRLELAEFRDDPDVVAFRESLSSFMAEQATAEGGEFGAALNNAIGARVIGLPPSPLAGVTITPRGTDPWVVDEWGGYIWGVSGNTIMRKSGPHGAWSAYCDAAGGSLARLLPTSDGEVLAFHAAAVYKSTGWASGTPTWGAPKVTRNGTSTILPWGVDGSADGTKFIVTEYSATRADSFQAWISVNSGASFTVGYDAKVLHGEAAANASHIHGVAYDDWTGRFYISEGHNAIAGIYHSTAAVPTPMDWARPAAMAADPSPTVLVATDDGLCCGSDNERNGMYGVVRRADPMDEELVQRWQWETGRDGLVGFAQRGFRDPETGLVYMGWISNFDGVAPIITAGTATSGDVVYTWSASATTGSKIDNAVIRDGYLIGSGVAAGGGGNVSIKALVTPPGSGRQGANRGHIEGGTASAGSSLAAGPRANTGTAIDSIAVGAGASVTGNQRATVVGRSASSAGASTVVVGTSASSAGALSVAVGNSASSAGGFQVVIGNEATAASVCSRAVVIGNSADATTGVDSVVVGAEAQSSANDATVVGRSAVGSGVGASAFGRTASASATSATALGSGTVASATLSTAVGRLASATHASSVALGSQTATSREFQVSVGARHFELTEATNVPLAAKPAADKAWLWVDDNGAGKTRLCVKFSDGAEHVLAVQA